ncbi:ATP-binding cassette domain-containing protein [Finegoldia sp. BIOML-A3]|uniref:ATP-binding cassette domain-containing protein n=1 Tax=Finegoldia TaxID=150022 RepID=UPI000B91A0F0|nr:MULTISPECIES: ATP-binding cassette domain-containing protein [Finegoldia]MDU2131586.1 ATP-binding cassette domain-containing protein [Finegoldia magna]MDU2219898.1 ATP-binding cassette domain-containing protein [Finegoldia magna]MDU4277343.1 ATP-binding cassette domain-containing protein [Finegoldia magna]MDU6551619.1 ATP-binding cassette domain-containing protein [Finegoldia magna]MSA98335.1 ATP-binding cassette domain-containing protein [Finegoldia sp. BIOML-A3]
MLECNIEKKLNHFILNVDFTVENEILCIMGESGSGKTSILNSIAGLLTPDKGEIILDDNILFSDKINLKPQERKIGYVFQDYALFPNMSVKDNIFFMNPDINYTKLLIEKLGIEYLLGNFPNTLSGGEKQKVSIVRALANKPRLLLMDEPFSSIDEKFKNKFYEELIEIKKSLDIPIIMVTHNRVEAEILSDRLIFIDKGKIVK